jgi:hypothetical protein
MKRSFLLALLLAFASLTQAAVIHSGAQNILIPTTFDGVYVDIDTGNTSTSPILGWDVNFFFGGVGIGASTVFQPARMGTGNMATVLRYALLDVIDGSLLYAGAEETGSSDHLSAPGNFQDGVEGYLGFRFTKNDSSGPYFGYMRVTLTGNTPGGIIHDWAWEDSGLAIMIPEPGRAVLLLLGGIVGVVRRRR